MDKKAITPLVATILLIGFTVVIAIFVLSFGQNWLSELTKTTEESAGEGIACATEGGIKISACATDADTIVTITNSGKKPFLTYTLSVCNASNCVSKTDGSALAVGTSEIFTAAGISTMLKLSSSFTLDSSRGSIVCQGLTLTEAKPC